MSVNYQLSITRFVPPQHHPDGHTYIEIFANLRVPGLYSPVEFDTGYPYTVRVSRREGHDFNHGCASIEAAQKFLEQHHYDISKIAPAGKVRAYYLDGSNNIQYFYQGRTYKGEPHWRSDEHGGAWLTPAELKFVIDEAATYQWTKDREILTLAVI